MRGGTVRPPSGQSGLLITAANVTLDGVTLIGPQATTYSSTEVGIEVEGRATAPLAGIVVRDCRVSRFGYGGMYLRHVRNVQIRGNTVSDGVYAGIMVLSADGGTIDRNSVARIGVVGSATMGGNAYGIALTRGGGTVTSDPPSSDVVVSNNHVDSVPTWHAYDTHGGARITWTGNVATNSRSGIFITGASGSDGMVRSVDNDIDGNEFDAPSGSIHYAITSVYSTGGFVRNNVTVGWPSDRNLLTTSSGDPGATAVGLTVSNNTWR